MPVDQIHESFSTIGLVNGCLSVQVIPELGGKILSLFNFETGREWMWRPTAVPRLFRNRTGDPISESTLVGADECLPTISECHWRGLDLPDHGEVWAEPWNIDSVDLERHILKTLIRLSVSPLHLERAIQLTGSHLKIDYALKMTSGEKFEYVWTFHPLMTIREGDRLLLPSECRKIRAYFSVDTGLPNEIAYYDYPSPASGMELDRLNFGDKQGGLKFFTDPLTLGRAAIWNEREGDYIVFAFDAGINNTLGIWLNRGGWNGYHHVAIEPTNGAPDPLDVAVKDWKRFGVISAGEVKQWSLLIYCGKIDRIDSVDSFLAGFHH